MSTIQEQISEVEREIDMRNKVYPGLIARGSMAKENAQLKIKLMEDVIVSLKSISAKETFSKGINALSKQLSDEEIFPFGKYKESKTKMKDVPAYYLLCIGDKDWIFKWMALHEYIEKHRDYLEKEVEENES